MLAFASWIRILCRQRDRARAGGESMMIFTGGSNPLARTASHNRLVAELPLGTPTFQ
jgi:hypothetical protein